MKKMSIKKRGVSIFMMLMMLVSMSMTAFAEEASEDLSVDLGNDTIIDVDELADEYGVDPYELKSSIEAGLDEEKASPFSSLAVDESKVSRLPEEVYSIERYDANTNKVSKNNQDSTAYVANAGALTASGKTPAVGMCAMHVDVTTKTGSTTSSTVKLGTTIYMTNNVNVNGTSCSSFVVEDRGRPKNRTSYWIDIYFGQKTDATYKAAINYGLKTVSYYYYKNI